MKALEELAREALAAWYKDHPGVTNIAQAREEIAGYLRDQIAAHPELLEPDDAVSHALSAADKALTDEGKAMFSRFLHGEGTLPLTEFYDSIIPLGHGDRIKFGDMSTNEYLRADALRHRNVRAAQDSYNAWRDVWDRLLPGMERGARVRDIPLNNDDGEF